MKKTALPLTLTLTLLFTLTLGYCSTCNAAVPFSYDDLSSTLTIYSPWKDFTYSDSDILINASLHIGYHESERGTYYIPYQNISCVYSLDGSDWQNLSLVSVNIPKPFHSMVNPYWYSTAELGYSATLHDLSEGEHYLQFSIKPDNLAKRFSVTHDQDYDYSTSSQNYIKFTVNASAQYLPEITINPDGSLTPETEYIIQNGNLYTLASNIHRAPSIIINCSNIVFDGAGHTSKGNETRPYGAWTGLQVNGENITVKDLKVTGFGGWDICFNAGKSCTLLRVEAEEVTLVADTYGDHNTIAESNITRLCFFSLGCHTVMRNNISDLHGMGFGGSTFYENNFKSFKSISILLGSNISWDNGSVGNCWGDYIERYPNASEIEDTGIWDTPYVIDTNNIDNYPLVNPFIVMPSPEPQPEPEPFPTVPVVAFLASVIVVAIGLVICFKKRRGEDKP